MRKRARKPARRPGIPSAPVTQSADSAQPSLPPVALDAPRPPDETVRKMPGGVKYGAKTKQKALQILAMRSAGMSNEDIAKAVKLSVMSLKEYVYRAGKMGWVQFDDPTDQIEYRLMHKVVRNLNQGLDDENRNERTMMPVKTEVALRVAEGTIFKRFGDDKSRATPPTMALSIKIENTGQTINVREGTVNGEPAYVEGEVVK